MTKTFSDFDKFGLEPFADQLTKYLQVEFQFVDESFVLSLNSEFGSGKSTFFEMWANKLKSTQDTFKVVYINAWKSDFQGDALLAIVSCLLDNLNPGKEMEPIKETAGKLCKFALSIGNDVVQKFTGVDIIKAGEYAGPDGGDPKTELGHACFQLYHERQKLFDKLKVMLSDLVRKSELPILIIIDELDRCKPNYAIEFLETIKHVFDIKRIVFVIGVDKNQLASSAKALFGQELIFDEYYRKFSYRDISLPVKSQPMIKHFCQQLVNEYLSDAAFKKKNRFSYAQHNISREDNIVELCITFSINARQMHEFFRIVAHVFSITKKSDTILLWGWQIGVFFMTAISIKNRRIYDQIGRDEISLSEFTAFLKKHPLFSDKEHGLWWAALLYLGHFRDQPLDLLEKEFQTLGIWNPDSKNETTFQDQLNELSVAYGRIRSNKSIFSEIYQIIESLRTFER